MNMTTSVGRNDPCPCGSGKKYKKCCETKDQAKEHARLEKRWQEAQRAVEKSQDKEGAANEEKTAAPPVTARKPDTSFRGAPSKHAAVHAPKSSLPRRTGGG